MVVTLEIAPAQAHVVHGECDELARAWIGSSRRKADLASSFRGGVAEPGIQGMTELSMRPLDSESRLQRVRNDETGKRKK
jgi:hypothetical protein